MTKWSFVGAATPPPNPGPDLATVVVTLPYSLTEEQLMLEDMIGRLAREKIAPGAAERDEKGEFAADMAELLRENGLFGADTAMSVTTDL